MADAPADTFMTTLKQAETSKDVGPLVALFAADAEVGSIATKEPRRGTDGARQFWSDYLAAFGTVASTFKHVRADAKGATLEWTSEGTLPTGAAINYQGVSVLEFDGGGKVKRFRTYYDSAAFLPEGAKTLGREATV